MGKCKIELDIKFNELLINAAHAIKLYCHGRLCDDCIFLKYDVCVFGNVPDHWEV